MPFGFSSLLLGGAAVLVFLIGGVLAFTSWFLLKTIFLCDRMKAQPDDAVPEYLQPYFADAIAFLESHQFQLAGYYIVEATQGNVQWSVFLQDAAQQIHAAIVIRQPQNVTFSPVQIAFVTAFEDDTRLETINERDYKLLPQKPKLLAQYHESADIDELLQIHQRKLSQLLETKTARTLNAEQYLDDFKAQLIQETERLVQLGKVSWVQPQESYRWRWWTALTSAAKIYWAMGFSKPKTRKSSDTEETSNTISLASNVEIEFAEFQRQQQQQTRLSRRLRSWIFLGTLALFVTVYASAFDVRGLLIFVAVLLLHEGGHVLAMKLFGYQDTAILFIPYLGALATARKQDATLTEKVWISLAGPLPGLCLAMGLAMALNLGWIEPSAWIQEAILILVVLNLFNLLPLYPLDGGQVADLLLFSQNPYLGSVFKAIGVGLLLLIGLLSQSFLLLGFAALIGFSIPSSLRLAKLNVQLQRELRANSQTAMAAEDRDALARLLFQRLQQAPYRRLPFNQKSMLVTGILDSRQETAAPWTTRVGLSSVYLASLLVGLVGGVVTIWSALAHYRPAIDAFQEPEPESSVQTLAISHPCGTVSPAQDTKIGEATTPMADRQIILIGTFATVEQARTVWQEIRSSLEPTDSGKRFGLSVFAATANTATRDRVNRKLKTAGATVLIENPHSDRFMTVRIAAEAPDAQRAMQSADELANFFDLSGSFTQLRAPWDSTAHLTAEQQTLQTNARYTYVQLLTAQQQVFSQLTSPPFFPFRMLVATLTRNRQWMESMLRQQQNELYLLQRQAVQQLQNSGDERLDGETINLFLDKLKLQNRKVHLSYVGSFDQNQISTGIPAQDWEALQASIQAVQDRLAARMGKSSAPPETSQDDSTEYWLAGQVKQSGTRLSVEQLRSNQIDRVLPAIATYFCQQQFSNISYDLELQQDLWDDDEDY